LPPTGLIVAAPATMWWIVTFAFDGQIRLARAWPGTPLSPRATIADHPSHRPNPIRWPHPCDAIMGFAILFR